MADAKITLRATDAASAVLSRVRSNLAQTAQSAAQLGAALSVAGVAGIGGLLALAKGTIDTIDAFNDLKDATGASIENLSALEDVAARTGTSFDSVGSALVKFNETLKDASKPGSEAEQVFKALGLSIDELKRLDPAEALRRTSVALAGFADDGNKARLVQELFGRSVREVAPFLKDLAEQTGLVATVSTEAAEEAEKFNKGLAELAKNAEDLKRALIGDVIFAINEAAKALRESGLLEGFRTLFTGNDEFKNNKRLVQLTDELLRAENRLGAARARDAKYGDRSLETAAAERSLANIKAELATVQSYRKLLQEGINPKSAAAAPLPTLPTISGSLKAPSKSKAKAETDEAAQALAAYVKGLSSAVERTLELTEVEKARNFLLSLGRTGEIDQVRELVLGLAEQIDAEKALTDTIKLKREAAIAAGDAVNEANEKRAKQIAGLLDATPSAELARQREDVKLLTEEFEAGRLAEEGYLEAVTARLKLTGEEAKKTKSLAEELGLTFTSAFEDAIVGGKGLRSLLSGLGQDITRILARKLVTEPLGNAVTGVLGGAGGGGIGALASQLFAGFFADGGAIPAGKFGITGERGMELVAGPAHVYPLEQLSTPAARGQTVHYAPVFYLNAPVDRRTQDQLAAQAFAGAQRAFARGY